MAGLTITIIPTTYHAVKMVSWLIWHFYRINSSHPALGVYRIHDMVGRFPIIEQHPFENVGIHTVDGRNPANQLIASFTHYLQGFIHPIWCRSSSINSRSEVSCWCSPAKLRMSRTYPPRHNISEPRRVSKSRALKSDCFLLKSLGNWGS